MSRGAAEDVAGRVDRAGEFAARSIAEARASSAALSRCAREQAAALSTLVSAAHGAAAEGGGASGLTAATSDLVDVTRALVDRVKARCASQEAAASRAVSSAESLATFARDVTAVAADARLVALNANVVASRLGHTGVAAAVISRRVQAFAIETQAEVHGLVELSRELTLLLPSIAEKTASVRAATARFRATSEAQLARVEATRDMLARQLRGEVGACGERARGIAAQALAIEADLGAHFVVEDLLAEAASASRSGDVGATGAALDAAITASLAHVSPASERLAALNALASQQVEALASLVRALRGDGDLDGASRELTGDVGSFVASTRADLEEQGRSVASALAAEARRSGADEACRRMVMEANLLTLAVRVEAGRLGDQGLEIVPIAEHLGAFSASLHRVVAGAASSTSELRRLLLQIQSEGKLVSAAVEAFAASAPRARGALDRAMDRVTSGVVGALEASRARAGALLTASHDLIGTLQFQDRLTQEVTALAGAIRAPGEALPERSFLETKPEGGLSAGDLMLF